MKIVKQALKYSVVGVGNTLVTLAIIWCMTKWWHTSEVLANVVGYAVGVTNSFFWNWKWTFQSEKNWREASIRFFLVFAVCYAMQLGVLMLLNRYCPENPPLYAWLQPLLRVFGIDALFYIQLCSTVFYTVVNFIINKYYTFKP